MTKMEGGFSVSGLEGGASCPAKSKLINGKCQDCSKREGGQSFTNIKKYLKGDTSGCVDMGSPTGGFFEAGDVVPDLSTAGGEFVPIAGGALHQWVPSAMSTLAAGKRRSKKRASHKKRMSHKKRTSYKKRKSPRKSRKSHKGRK